MLSHLQYLLQYLLLFIAVERAEAHEVWWGWAIGQNNIDTITKCDHGCSVLPPKDHPVIRFVDDFFAQGISEESF